MYSALRFLLLRIDPEKAHKLALTALSWLPKYCLRFPVVNHPVRVMGLDFPHLIGLAAGLDKNGKYLDALDKLQFSFIEIGTVTPKPQSGNPKPRLFRLTKVGGLINRMGFNNLGVETLVSYINKAKYKGILGINISKNKDTSLTLAAADYIYCLRKVYPYASYVTINVSSPNTLDLRKLQQDKFLADLLAKLTFEQQVLANQYQRFVPLVIKLSPDENDESLKRMTDIILANKIAGIIATNTTISRTAVKHQYPITEEGGLSGAPLFERSTYCLRLLKQLVGTDVTLIASGGIDSIESARIKLQAGASLLQIYTGLIYQGPALINILANAC